MNDLIFCGILAWISCGFLAIFFAKQGMKPYPLEKSDMWLCFKTFLAGPIGLVAAILFYIFG